MSDTMIVKTLCAHGRADPHHISLGTAVCPGGKEMVLRRRGCYGQGCDGWQLYEVGVDGE